MLAASGCHHPPGDDLEGAPPEPPVRALAAPDHIHDCVGVLCDETVPARLYSGEFVETEVDLRVEGRGLDVVWGRYYRAQRENRNAMGVGWTHSYDVRLEKGEEGFVLHDGINSPVLHEEVSEGRHEAAGYHRVLLERPEGIVVRFADGGRWLFHPLDHDTAPGRLARIIDRNGNRIALRYASNGLLVGLRDTLDRDYTISYDADGQLAAFEDFTGRVVRYGYAAPTEGAGSGVDLVSVTLPTLTTYFDPENERVEQVERVRRYTYTEGHRAEVANHNLVSLIDELGDVVYENVYGSDDPGTPTFDRLVEQRRATRSHGVQLAYDQVRDDAGRTRARTWLNDGEGFVHSFTFDAKNALVSEVVFSGRADPDEATTARSNRPRPAADEPERYETRTKYDLDHHLVMIERPDGSVTRHDYPAAESSVLRRGRLLAIRERTPEGQERTWRYAYGDKFADVYGGTAFATAELDPTRLRMEHVYDGRGNRIETAFPADPARTVQWGYNEHGQEVLHLDASDPEGRRTQTRRTYFGADDGEQRGYLSAVIVDPEGLALTTTYQVDARGNDLRSVDARGNDTLRKFNEADEILVEWTPEKEGLRRYDLRRYDPRSTMVGVEYQNVDHDGQVLRDNPTIEVRYVVDTLGQEREVGQENGIDAAGRPRWETARMVYDNRGNVTQFLSPAAVDGSRPGATEAYEFDARGLLRAERSALRQPEATVTSYTYDLRGSLVATVVDAEGSPRRTETLYDGWGREIGEIDPMGNMTRRELDDADRVLGEQRFGELLDLPGSGDNVLLGEMRFEYDATGRMVTRSTRHFDPHTGMPRGDGWQREHLTLDGRGEAFEELDAVGGLVARSYDTAGRHDLSLDPSGASTQTTLDGLGYKVAQLSDLPGERGDLQFATRQLFDPLGDMTDESDERGATRAWRFDSRGNETIEIDALVGSSGSGNVRHYDYDDMGREQRAVFELRADGTGDGAVVGALTVERRHDATGLEIAASDTLGNTTHVDYDGLSRPVRVTYPDGTAETMAYDGSGNLVERRDPNGTLRRMEYDLLDRLVRVEVAPGPGVAATTTFEQFAYDGSSNMVLARNDATSVRWTHDSVGDVVTETSDAGEARVDVDAMGRTVAIGYPSGRLVEYLRDTAGRIETISDADGVIAELDHVGPDWLETRRYPELDAVTTYERFGTGQVYEVQHWLGDAPLLRGGFESDAEGQKIGAQDPVTGLDASYGHDSVGRTTGLDLRTFQRDSMVRYEYDAGGNWRSVERNDDPLEVICAGAYGVDELRQQFTQSECERFDYDPAGSMVSVTPRTPGAREERRSYDFKHRLVQVDRAHERIELGYDARDRLVRIERRDRQPDCEPEGPAVAVVKRTWLGERVLEERRGPAGRLVTYVYGDGREPRPMQRSRPDDGQRLYYFEDDVETVVATAAVNEWGQVTVERYDYSHYGYPRVAADATALSSLAGQHDNDRLFGGLVWLAPVELYDARLRFMDPRLGRFITVDPAGRWTDGAAMGNPYVYAGNQPETSVDFSGTKKTPNFEGFSRNQSSRINNTMMKKAEFRASHLRKQADWVMTPRKRTRDRYYDAKNLRDWFGNYGTWIETSLLRDNAKYIHQRAKNDVIRFKSQSDNAGLCGVSRTRNAWTFPMNRNARIYLCSPYFWRTGDEMYQGRTNDADGTPTRNGYWRTRTSTVLHEISHNAGFSVYDPGAKKSQKTKSQHIFGKKWPRKSKSSRRQSRRNADSYAMAALDCAFGNGRIKCKN